MIREIRVIFKILKKLNEIIKYRKGGFWNYPCRKAKRINTEHIYTTALHGLENHQLFWSSKDFNKNLTTINAVKRNFTWIFWLEKKPQSFSEAYKCRNGKNIMILENCQKSKKFVVKFKTLTTEILWLTKEKKQRSAKTVDFTWFPCIAEGQNLHQNPSNLFSLFFPPFLSDTKHTLTHSFELIKSKNKNSDNEADQKKSWFFFLKKAFKMGPNWIKIFGKQNKMEDLQCVKVCVLCQWIVIE